MWRLKMVFRKVTAILAGEGLIGFVFAVIMLSTSTVTAKEPDARSEVELTTKEAVQQTAEAVAEKVVEKVAEKAAEKMAEKAENTSKRPAEWFGPTRVTFLMFVVDVDEIDDASQNFMANVYLRLKWKDLRLADPAALPRQMSMEDVWNPRILLVNQQGIIAKSLPEVVQVDPDGTVTYHQRYAGRMSQPLRLFDFPMDTHPFEIRFVATGYTANDLRFVADEVQRGNQHFLGGEMASELSLPNWQVLSYETVAEPYNPIPELNTASFAFRFEAKRYIGYFLWQVVLPLVVVVVMSWSAFWIDGENVGARTSMATSSVLTLITLRFVLSSLLPRLPYMTRMDYLTVGSTILVLLAMIVVLATSFLRRRHRDASAECVDRWASIGFPSIFLLLFGWFVSGMWLAT
jgi:hypothetical protein